MKLQRVDFVVADPGGLGDFVGLLVRPHGATTGRETGSPTGLRLDDKFDDDAPALSA